MTTFAASEQSKQWRNIPGGRIWLQWVLANAGAEVLGLGASALLWITMMVTLQEQVGIVISALLVVVGSTVLEGTAVGVGQWLVLRRVLPRLRWQSWLVATAAGALIAWTLGMVPSSLLSMGESSGAAEPPAISNLLMYSLAALMGLVLGPILGTPQWLVLRRHLPHAIWWIPANAVAWAAGMAVIFVGSGLIPANASLWTIVPILLLDLIIAGAVVGAIHGAVLLWMLSHRL